MALRFSQIYRMLGFAALMVAGAPVYAQDRAVVYSPYLAGSLGLNLVPNARMDEVGTVRLNTSTLAPYVNVSLGVQVIDPLHVSVRQTAEVSNIIEDPIRLYPGIDLKLRLLNESRLSPEIAVGLQSALGHKRTAGEFLAASKRYKNFDFTGGLGWERDLAAGAFCPRSRACAAPLLSETETTGRDFIGVAIPAF